MNVKSDIIFSNFLTVTKTFPFLTCRNRKADNVSFTFSLIIGGSKVIATEVRGWVLFLPQ